jgi:DNA-binding CsgD family transcriptional regulator
MDAERLNKLNEAQRICLRMVFMHMSSKDIARELGISPHTVDQRLKAAIQILGVDSRVEAARLLARAEGGATYQPLVYQSPDIAEVASQAPIHSLVDREGNQGQSDHAMRENQAAFRMALSQPRPALPLPLARGDRNDLTTGQRLGWIVAIAIAVALSFGAILAGLDALSRLI